MADSATTLQRPAAVRWLVAPAIGQFTGKDAEAPAADAERVQLNNVPLGAACAVVADGLDSNDYILADTQHQCLKRVEGDCVVPFAGSGDVGFQDGPKDDAAFSDPCGLAVSPTARDVYVADTGNNAIRVISRAAGLVSTLAGGPTRRGYSDGPVATAKFSELCDVQFWTAPSVHVGAAPPPSTAGADVWLPPSASAAGAPGADTPPLIVADTGNNCIRLVRGGEVTTLAGSPTAGLLDGFGTAAQFRHPSGLACDDHGFIFVADTDNHVIRRLSPDGTVITFAGDGTAGFKDGPRVGARFSHPCSITLGPTGTLIVADTGNHAIREIGLDGVVVTVAGGSAAGYSDGFGAASRFCSPCFVACMPSGLVFTSEHGCCIVRALTRQEPARLCDSDTSAAGGAGTVAAAAAAGDTNGGGDGSIASSSCVRPIDGRPRARVPAAVSAALTPTSLADGASSRHHRDRLFNLVDNPTFCDVAFGVEDQHLFACRSVLAAQSEYFRMLLYGPMSEGVHLASSPVHNVAAAPSPSPPLALPSSRRPALSAGAVKEPETPRSSPPPCAGTVFSAAPAPVPVRDAGAGAGAGAAAAAAAATACPATPASPPEAQDSNPSRQVSSSLASPAACLPSGVPVINIPDCSMAAFRAIVVYLTTNRLVVALEDAVETVALADQYGLSQLHHLLLRFVSHKLDVDNAIPLLIQASQLRMEAVNRLCLDFIKANRALVSSHSTFLELADEGNATLAVSLARLFATTPPTCPAAPVGVSPLAAHVKRKRLQYTASP